MKLTIIQVDISAPENSPISEAIMHLLHAVQNQETTVNTKPGQPAPVPVAKEFVVRNCDGETSLNINDITFLEGNGNSVAINYYGKAKANSMLKIITGKNMKPYEHLTAEAGFFRCHQSFIVNLNHVKLNAANQCFMIMVNGTHRELPISCRCWRKHKAMLLSLSSVEFQEKAA
jgi:two-component system LytT family response regulator